MTAQCLHGKNLHGDDCDECSDVEMSMFHCRLCGSNEYYPEDFKHLPGCEIPGGSKELPNWRRVHPNVCRFGQKKIVER